MKKIGILLVILILIGSSILIYLIYLNKNQQEPTLPGTVIDEELLKEDIRLIASKDLSTMVTQYWRLDNENLYSVQATFNIKRSKNNYVYPYNMREAIRIWLYLEEREPIVEVHEVQVTVFQTSWGSARRIHISKEEFQGLLEQLDSESFSTEQLTFMYIDQYNYPRWWEIEKKDET